LPHGNPSQSHMRKTYIAANLNFLDCENLINPEFFTNAEPEKASKRNYPESISQDLQRPPTPPPITPEDLEKIAPLVRPDIVKVREKLRIDKANRHRRQNLQVEPGNNPVPIQKSDYYCKHRFNKVVNPANHRPPPDLIYQCSPGFIQGVGTASGNKYYKIVTCGLEWCPQCGEIHSHPHERRILRTFEKLIYLHSIKNSTGYLVITIPKGLRNRFLNKDALNDFRNYWRRKLKREGYPAGIIRYHWAGEDGITFKPHLNILLPEKFIDRKTFDTWRAELSQWFKVYFELETAPAPNLWYQYSSEIKKAKFWLRYVTRATMKNYHPEASKIIKGFRNSAPFGKFQKLEHESEKIESQIIKNRDIDEITGEIGTIVWLKRYNEKRSRWQPDLLPTREFLKLKTENLSAGFWILKPDPPNLKENQNLCGQLSQEPPPSYYLPEHLEEPRQSKLMHRAPPSDW
jgi:hypothetical protein